MEELNNPTKLIWSRKCVLFKRTISFTTCWSVILATSWQGILLVGFKDRSRWKCNTQIQIWHSGGGKPGQVKRLPSGEGRLVTIRVCLSLFPRPGLVLDAVARNYAVGEYSNPNNGCNICTIFVRCFLCVQNAFAHSGFQRCKRRQMLEKPRGCQNHNIWKRDNLGQ